MPVLTDTSVRDDQAELSADSAPPDSGGGSRRPGESRPPTAAAG